MDVRGHIDSKHKEIVQAKADEFIQRALSVTVFWLTEAELRERRVVVSEAVPIPEVELVRAVDIVGAEAYPCGGTHVSDKSMIGKMLIKDIRRSKSNRLHDFIHYQSDD